MAEALPARAARVLTLMSRRECPLCDEFHAKLARWEPLRHGCTIDVVDIDTDPELTARYGFRVPVLMDGDAELCAGHFDEYALRGIAPTA